jgi:hypothetical protein
MEFLKKQVLCQNGREIVLQYFDLKGEELRIRFPTVL